MIRGVIHVGAHVANEADVYEGIKDVLWVEANPEVFGELQTNVRAHGHRTALALLSETSGQCLEFHVMSGDKGSSSVHKPTRHLEQYPHITETHTIPIRTTTLDDLIDDLGSDANMLVIDAQGHELSVLIGGQRHMEQFDIVIAEGYPVPLYEGATTSGELCDAMLRIGYSAIASHDFDLLFIKQSLVRVALT